MPLQTNLALNVPQQVRRNVISACNIPFRMDLVLLVHQQILNLIVRNVTLKVSDGQEKLAWNAVEQMQRLVLSVWALPL